MSELYSLRLSVSNTGNAPGYDVPVPLGYEMFYDIIKTKAIPAGLRKEFHDLLEGWLNEVEKNPEQFGSHMSCAFQREFRGDRDDWKTVEEQQADIARETIKFRLSELVKLTNK